MVACAPFAGTQVVASLSGEPARHLQVDGWTRMPRDQPRRPPACCSLRGSLGPRLVAVGRVGSEDGRTSRPRPPASEDDCGPPGAHQGSVTTTAFLPDGTLISVGMTGLRRWDLATGTSEKLRDCLEPYGLAFYPLGLAATPDGRQIVTLASEAGEVSGRHPSRLTVFDLEARTSREITTHGTQVRAMALDPTGRILVTHGYDATLRVGPLTGEEPHLLTGGGSTPWRSRCVSGRPLDRERSHQGGRHPPLANARPDATAVPHAPARRAAPAAPDEHQSAGRRGPGRRVPASSPAPSPAGRRRRSGRRDALPWSAPRTVRGGGRPRGRRDGGGLPRS